VSHVVNGTRYVRPTTRARVEQAIRAFDYRPSGVARGLATSSTSTIGLVIADVTSPFFARLLVATERLLTERGYSIVAVSTFEDPRREREGLETLLQRRVDGIIITPTGADQDTYGTLERKRCPLVFVERLPPDARGCYVGTDNARAIDDCVRYLFGLGHRRITLLTGAQVTSAEQARVRGFGTTCAELGLAPDEAFDWDCGSTREGVEGTVTELLTRGTRPTALIAGNYLTTLGALTALQRLQLGIPDDVSLVCFDNSPWSGLVNPALTVVTKPIEELARRAVDQLFAAIDEKRRQLREGEPVGPLPVTSVLLTTTLHVRQSCRPPALERRASAEAGEEVRSVQPPDAIPVRPSTPT
jgi:LacI family transcriptional regulator